MAIAMGEMSMSYIDFRSLTPSQFALIYERYLKGIEKAFKDEWERVRFMCAVLLSPHSKKPLRPQDICSFEWEKKENIDTTEVKKRFNELKNKWDK